MGLFYVGCRVLNPVTSKSTAVRRLMVDLTAKQIAQLAKIVKEEFGSEEANV